MTPLTLLQNDMAALAGASELFTYTPIMALRELATASEISAALACMTAKNGQTGTQLIVLMATLGVKEPNARGPIGVGRITLRCLEAPKTKTSGSPTAEELALNCLNLFHLWLPGYVSCVRAAKDAVQPSIELAPKLAYDVTFEFDLALDQTARVAVPQIAVASNITITCGTAGASVYYTTDTSLPTATNGTPYSAPFTTPASGTVVRVAAYKTSLSPSNIAQTIIP